MLTYTKGGENKLKALIIVDGSTPPVPQGDEVKVRALFRSDADADTAEVSMNEFLETNVCVQGAGGQTPGGSVRVQSIFVASDVAVGDHIVSAPSYYVKA